MKQSLIGFESVVMNAGPAYNLALLMSLLPPPDSSRSAPTPEQLDKLAASEGIKFPDDYKQITTVYGAGWIDDFLRLNSIIEEKGGATFMTQLKSSRVELAHLVEECVLMSTNIWPSKNCLIPWARTSNGDLLLTNQKGDEVVVVDSKGNEMESYGEGIIEFLCKYLNQERQVSIFPYGAVLDGPVHTFSVKFGKTFDKP